MTPRPTAASRVAEHVARHRGPLSRLRARGTASDLVRRRPPVLELYYEPGDPHSHLCAQLLGMMQERVSVPIRIRLVGESGPEDYPERERQRAYALADAERIAPAYGLHFPSGAVVPNAAAREWAAGELAGTDTVRAFCRREQEVSQALFGGAGGPLPAGDVVRRLLAENAIRRHRLGHNLPGMWQFDGDWFWGVDRLDHLAARLRARGALRGQGPLATRDARTAALPELGDALPSLEFFFSFRSPYSYLAAVRLQRFQAAWPGDVVIRPVLPMAMRSLPVPRVKRLYTLRDAKREAERLQIPFGRVADPLGAGAQRCLQVFPLAGSTVRQLDFLVSAGTAIWSEGIDVASEEGIAHICRRAGMDPAAARAQIADGVGIEYAEANRRDLLEAGLWGVPCYRVGDFTAWGQDRFWMLGELLRRSRRVSAAAETVTV